MEILYVKATGQVLSVKPDGSAWGTMEVTPGGAGVEPFGFLRTDTVPDTPQDWWVVTNGEVQAVEPVPAQQLEPIVITEV